ncbi:MAG: S8 family serine peptidase [Pseudomonadota bacterium]
MKFLFSEKQVGTLASLLSVLALAACGGGHAGDTGGDRSAPQAAQSLSAGASASGRTDSSSGSSAAADLLDFAKGRILVAPREGLPDEEFNKILAVHGGKASKIGQSNLYIVHLTGNASEKAVAATLAHNPHLKFAEVDGRVKSTLVPNDSYLGSEWHLTKIKAASAWDTTQGTGITIAILDTGVDPTHPDLVGNLVPGYNFYDNNTNTSDVCGHGTKVAGTAAASTGNGIGVAGVAGQAKIMPIRIAEATNGCYGSYSAIASGLIYAADHGARVANVSYGGLARSATVQSAAQYLKNKGGLTFVSAGNNGIDESIIPTTTLIAVSATDGNDAKASWSSYGSFVALSAPGVGIWTTKNGGSYDAPSGTSFASPTAAGVAALMMAARPALDSTQLESLMYTSAVDLGVAGRDPYYGYGRVDATAGVQAALNAVIQADTHAPTASISSPAANASVSGLVAINVAATDNVGVARVELHVNGTTTAADSVAPFGFSWDSTKTPNGAATLMVKAYDAAGNAGTSAPVTVNVANTVPPITNDTAPPTVKIVNPVAGQVAGNVSISVNAADNSGAAGISLSLTIDGVVKASGTGGALAYNWNTRKVASGTHTIGVIAKDATGNSATASVQVTTK